MPCGELVSGMPVAVGFTKWGGHRHWRFDTVYLGADEHGHWVGGAQATPMDRPGVATTTPGAFVACFAHRRGFVATFNQAVPEQRVAVYVDITDVPVWTIGQERAAVTMVDLDLDVVVPMHEPVFVDDEDEFAEHQVGLGYPETVVAAARHECNTVFAEVCDRVEPYGRAGATWLADYVARL